MMKTDNMPALWALDEAAKRSGWSDWADYNDHGMGHTTVTAHARTIEKHEQPPVDQDVLDVRKLLGAWIETPNYFGAVIETQRASLCRAGTFDRTAKFNAALSKYREFKARDNA